jgi:DsbC/DsbD-like thiol-disulfide interchange protein
MIPLALALALAAPAPTPAPRVHLDLLGQVEDDGSVTLGLRYRIEEGWHIYWENPGDSGMATSARIASPDVWTAGPLLFPGPMAIEASGLTSYGYSGTAILLASLSPADGATLAGTISVSSTWLVCREICEPESATATLQLDRLTGTPLTAARGALPTPVSPDDGLTVSWSGADLELRIQAESAALFPSAALDLATGSARPRFVSVLPVPSRDGEEIVNSPATLLLRVRVRTQSGDEPLPAVVRVVRQGVARYIALELRRTDRPSDPAP